MGKLDHIRYRLESWRQNAFENLCLGFSSNVFPGYEESFRLQKFVIVFVPKDSTDWPDDDKLLAKPLVLKDNFQTIFVAAIISLAKYDLPNDRSPVC